jgi:hypothetical protein
MKQIILLAAAMCLFASSAAAFESVDSRADALNEQLKGNHSYHAYLARELADIATEEKAQHDITVAQSFMDMAEEHAAQAGGSK